MAEINETPLPIDREYIYKRATLHKKISELSYRDAEAALAFLREWAEGKKPVSQLWEEVAAALGAGE
ncbi:hypothetical protein [Paenibacillus naphthalenovorans]|uniref:hypothetical protein n=1 Tax=Paenibacillus naphthalenovorans TaxID=162209 RepID=UPI003D281646